MRRKARAVLMIVQEIARNLDRWLLQKKSLHSVVPKSSQGPKLRTGTQTCLEDEILLRNMQPEGVYRADAKQLRGSDP